MENEKKKIDLFCKVYCSESNPQKNKINTNTIMFGTFYLCNEIKYSGIEIVFILNVVTVSDKRKVFQKYMKYVFNTWMHTVWIKAVLQNVHLYFRIYFSINRSEFQILCNRYVEISPLRTKDLQLSFKHLEVQPVQIIVLEIITK